MLEIATTTHPNPPVVILRFSGGIDSSNYQLFQARVDEELEKGGRLFLLDFKNLDRISSAGLRVIHNLFNKLRVLHKDVNDDELRKQMSAGRYKSPHLKVANLSDAVAEIFQLGGFEIYIEVCKDEESGIASFK